jgi:hypothetical protein
LWHINYWPKHFGCLWTYYIILYPTYFILHCNLCTKITYKTTFDMGALWHWAVGRNYWSWVLRIIQIYSGEEWQKT